MCERKSSADTNQCRRRRGNASGAGTEILLQPVVQSMVRHLCPAAHGGPCRSTIQLISLRWVWFANDSNCWVISLSFSWLMCFSLHFCPSVQLRRESKRAAWCAAGVHPMSTHHTCIYCKYEGSYLVHLCACFKLLILCISGLINKKALWQQHTYIV